MYWIFSIRYTPEGVRDSYHRAVVGPAHSSTVEAALHLAGVPEGVSAEIRADATVRLFVERALDPAERGYYAPQPFSTSRSWIVCIGPVHGVVTEGAAGDFVLERALSRDRRQAMILAWAELAFGHEEATGLPQRGLRLLEEAIEVFQACGGSVEIAHELVTVMFGHPCGTIGQELGGVAVSLLALAAASGLSADVEECREVHRVLSKPVEEFSQRNAAKIKIAPVSPPEGL
jgi:hypothetical protein